MRKPRKPTRRGVVQFGLFNLGGMAFFVIGYLAFVMLYGVLHWPWLVAKMLADALGWSANFVIQYFLAFRQETKQQYAREVLGRFTAFSLLNLAIDYGIVAVLAWIGISPFIGLVVAASFFTMWKWLWYKHYVFKPRPEQQSLKS